jgi:putative tryptophan/tyrosine transport system substrate-binding protein
MRALRNQPSVVSKKALYLVLIVLLFARYSSAQAQPTKVPRIGYLSVLSLSAMADRIEAFRQGLRELGYVEGKNIVMERRYGEEKPERVNDLAIELVRLKVDAIVTGGNSATEAAKKATNTIPIVMTQASDPVASRFVASLARPGGSITGLSRLAPQIGGKRVELLKDVDTKLSRVAVLGTSTSPGNAQELREVELVAGALAVKLQYLDVLSSKEMESAFRAAGNGRADAVLMMSGSVGSSQRQEIAELAVRIRLPVIYESARSVEAGGLMSYGVNLNDLDRRAATYVDKILKGAKPGDLPVEQPTKFELVINLKAAKQIGVTISPSVLARADKIIR